MQATVESVENLADGRMRVVLVLSPVESAGNPRVLAFDSSEDRGWQKVAEVGGQ